MNVMVYQLENHGAKRAEIVLPPSAVFHSAWVGTQRVTQRATPTQLANENNSVTFSLNGQEADSSLTVRYITKQLPLGSTALINPAYPKTSFPVMQGRWTLWNSQQYVARAASRRAGTGSQPNWRHRLFGRMARPSEISIFKIGRAHV